MTFAQLMQEPQHLLLNTVSGSRAYNLHLPESDTDYKGIFVLPQRSLYGMQDVPQVNNASNDAVYFEIGRFMELLCKNNPNILELLSAPATNVLFRHPLMQLIKPEDFLSKLCQETFAGYAQTQIKKARGLNKKVNRPFEAERKTVADFCYVQEGRGSVPLNEWLQQKSMAIENCGLTALPHFRDTYLLYYHPSLRGIFSGPDANDVLLSSIPKEVEPVGAMQFNKDGYSVYCREYKEYWEWVEKRNDQRYQLMQSHGRNYDTKHMMHTMRLLTMAEEIALYGEVRVHRDDREFLLGIRRGDYHIDTLLQMVEDKMAAINKAYDQSDLPERPDEQLAESLLIRIREEFYSL